MPDRPPATPRSAAPVRKAACADAAGIARVHVESWRTTYRGIIPDGVLAGLSVEQRAEDWRRRLCAATTDDRVFVAERDGAIVGFASLGPPAEPYRAYDAELQTLYLLQSEQGSGTGHRLFLQAVETLRTRGAGSFMLMVLRDNHRARRFYEAHGGVVIGETSHEHGSETIPEVAYGWKNLALPGARGAATQ